MEKLKKILNKKEDELKPVYLIYGEERYLLDKFKNKFIDNFVDEKMKDFNLTFIEEDKDFFAKIRNSVNTLPAGTEKRYVVARCEDYFSSKTTVDQIMIDLLQNFPDTAILLIMVDGNIDGRIKINKELKKVGEIIDLKPPRYNDLDKWIRNEFKKRGKRIDNKSVKLLENMFNNKLQRLDSEIEKIVTYNYEQDLIRYDNMQDVVSKDRLLADNVIFSFVDALSEKKKGEALVILNEMIDSGELPLRILGNIIWQLKLLILVKDLKMKGKRPQEIAGILKQHQYPVQKSFDRSDNFSSGELEIILERFLEANLEIVTGKYNDKKMALEMALINM